MAHYLNGIGLFICLYKGMLMSSSRFIRAVTLVASMLSYQASAAIVPFDITVDFGSGLSVSQKLIFSEAEAFWESKILGYASTLSFSPGLIITASAIANDGVGGILGSAGPEAGYRNVSNNILYATKGKMQFDSADLGFLETNGTLFSVIVHEMAHVIGFGTLWTHNSLYNIGTGFYTGAMALQAYREEFDSVATYVPVELDGGPGTANGHWDETWKGPSSDVMTGYLEGAVTFSKTTFAAFRDLGYITADQSAPASNVPAPYFACGIFLLVGLSRRRILVV
jgi:hypothetical protein